MKPDLDRHQVTNVLFISKNGIIQLLPGFYFRTKRFNLIFTIRLNSTFIIQCERGNKAREHSWLLVKSWLVFLDFPAAVLSYFRDF